MLGIVLSKQAHQEHDQLVNIFTKNIGKQTYLAKGSKKINSKNAYYLEPFSCIDFGKVDGTSLDKITSVDSVKFFSRIRRDFTKSLIANYICKLVDTATEEQHKNEAIFDLLLQWLIFLEGVKQINSFIIDSFVLQLYSQLGFRPNLATENITDSIVFSTKRGGFASLADTRMSEETFSLNKKEIKLLKKMIQFSFGSNDFPKKLDKRSALKLHRIIFSFISYQTEHSISDWRKVLPKL
jgi:DNA repair protein RecO